MAVTVLMAVKSESPTRTFTTASITTKITYDSIFRHFCHLSFVCEGLDDVVGVKAPLGGVAQVIFHGVQVVEVGVQVRVHQDRGVEEDGEGQVEVEREVGEDQGETLIMDGMR